MENNICLECNKTLSGRIDKKFCDDSCRNNYNNRQNREDSKEIRRVNAILKKNRKVLKELCPEGTAKVSKLTLEAKEFNFSFYTSTLVTQKEQHVYHFCYEYGYRELSDTLYLVVKKDS